MSLTTGGRHRSLVEAALAVREPSWQRTEAIVQALDEARAPEEPSRDLLHEEVLEADRLFNKAGGRFDRLAQRFGTSATAIRDALRGLRAARWIYGKR